MSAFALVLSLSSAMVAPRVAVFGGSGFTGSRVCKTLVEAGCSVTSISRTGRAPAWAEKQPWSQQVNWASADALGAEPMTSVVGDIDAAVSCVGNMRPSPEWEGFFGLHWDYDTMVRENGEVNKVIAAAARRAGARRFVLLSVCSSKKWAYGGALEGYIDGKENGEKAVLEAFGDGGTCFVGPSLIYGGGRFTGFGKLLAGICDTAPIRGQIAFFKWLKGNAATGYGPQDAVGEVALTPPCDVEDVARAVSACVLNTIPAALRDEHMAQQRVENQKRVGGADDECFTCTYVDGTDQIREVAKDAGSSAVLAAAAKEAIGSEAGLKKPSSVVAVQEGAPEQSPSAFGSSGEGAFFGFRPFLFPWPPGVALVGFFAGAILTQNLDV